MNIQEAQELETLSLVASKTHNSIIIMDADGNFEWVNRGFEILNGMSFDNYVKLKGRNIRQNSNNENINDIIDEVLKTGKPCIYNGSFTDNDGNKKWFQTTISPVVNDSGAIQKLIAIDTDITHIKEAEDKIKSQNFEIQHQRDELHKLNLSKDQLFSIIAHDLKNPFHSIIGITGLLINNFAEVDDERKKMFLSMIKSSSTSAYTLLENLLSWARSQTNQVRFEPSVVNLTELIRHNIDLLSITSLEKGIKLNVDIPDETRVFADINLLDIILRNLISNALKFSPMSGTVNISCSISNSQALIKITDSGIGMDDTTISNLFRFGNSISTKGTLGEPGTGLGLIICKEFLEKHGSSLIIESSLNKGSTFSFTLPLAGSI